MARFRPPYPSHSRLHVSTVILSAEGTELTATVESTVDKVTVKGISGGSSRGSRQTVQGENEIEIYVSNEKRPEQPAHHSQGVHRTDRTVASEERERHHLRRYAQLHTLLGRATEGDTGGYIDPEQLSYNIYYYDPLAYPSNWVLLENVKECEYTFTPQYSGLLVPRHTGCQRGRLSSMMSGSAMGRSCLQTSLRRQLQECLGKSMRPNPGEFSLRTTMPNGRSTTSIISRRIYSVMTTILSPCTAAATAARKDVWLCLDSPPRMRRAAILSMNVYTGSRAAQVTINGYSTFHTDRMYKVGTLPVNAGEEIQRGIARASEGTYGPALGTAHNRHQHLERQ